jgi:hypothetical protein
LLVDFGSFHGRFDNVINDSFNYTVTRHRWNSQELKYRIFLRALIHVLAHFQRTTCSQIYFRFSSYLLRKPHVFVILTAIVNIQSDLFWHRKENIWYLSDVYALSFEKYKGNFSDKNVLLCTRLYKYAHTAICMRNVYTLIW